MSCDAVIREQFVLMSIVSISSDVQKNEEYLLRVWGTSSDMMIHWIADHVTDLNSGKVGVIVEGSRLEPFL